MSPNNHLIRVWMPVSFIEQREGRRWGSKVKKGRKFCKYPQEWPASRMGCVNFFFLAAIHRWTGSGCFPEQRHFGLTFRQRGRVPQGRPLHIDIILSVNKSSGKKRLKKKKQIQHIVRIGSSLLHQEGRQNSGEFVKDTFQAHLNWRASLPGIAATFLSFATVVRLWTTHAPTTRMRHAHCADKSNTNKSSFNRAFLSNLYICGQNWSFCSF